MPEFEFLMIDGEGDPNGPSYALAVSALYAVSYPIVFALRREGRDDLKVGPLEALWWLADGETPRLDPRTSDRSTWRWTAMIRQPDATAANRSAAIVKAERKVGPDVVARLRFARFHEGSSAQMMHWGPFADEYPNVVKLHAFIRERGLRERGKHHEIYLSDPRRVAPDRMRTVLRQPVESSTREAP